MTGHAIDQDGANVTCDSCGMPLSVPSDHALGDEAIPYCRNCTDASGKLQSREERLARFTQWSMREGNIDADAARAKAIAYLRSMPAWRDSKPD